MHDSLQKNRSIRDIGHFCIISKNESDQKKYSYIYMLVQKTLLVMFVIPNIYKVINDSLSTWWYFHTMEYHSAIKVL